MTVTRAHLDALCSGLKQRPFSTEAPFNRPSDTWNIFPGVAEVGFSPEVIARGPCWLWWSCWAEEAFDSEGALTRPMLLHWHGDRERLLLEAARVGLALRVVGEAKYDLAGRAVLAPEALAVTDLQRLLEGFRLLEERGCVAIPLAAHTQSSGWSSVAERQRHYGQTAIFWTSQAQDDLDELGMLSDGEYMVLYWRGKRERLAEGLRDGGLSVKVPDSVHSAFEVRSAHAAPTIATLADAEAFERPLPKPQPALEPRGGALTLMAHSRAVVDAPGAWRPGYQVDHLWWTPEGALLVSTCSSYRGSPEVPLTRVGPEGFVVEREFRNRWHCGGAAWLPDGRLLLGWVDYNGGRGDSLVRLEEHQGDEEPFEPFAISAGQWHNTRALFGVDAAGRWLVHGTNTGVMVRVVGPPRTALKERNPNIRVRRKRPRAPQPPKPWEKVALHRADVYEDFSSYVPVAISPDGARLGRIPTGGRWILCLDRETGAELWRADALEGHYDARSISRLVFSPDSARLAVVSRRHVRERREDEGRTFWRLLLFDAATGQRRWPAEEAAAGDASAFAFAPGGQGFLAGGPDGVVRAVGPGGEALGALRVFQHGAVSSIAVTADGRIAAGSDRGELATLRWALE